MPLLTKTSNRNGLLVAALMLLAVSFTQASSEKGAELWFTGNYQGAVTIWKEAAANGERSAEYNLGWAFENGLGVIQDLEQSLYWYRLAASKGDRYAQLKLIQIWSDYGLASVDFAEIEEYSGEILAAKQGDFMAYLEDEAVQDKAYAKYLLSMFALGSSGSREKVNSAIERLISASGQGHVLAQFALGEWYLGSDSGEPAIDEAIVWLKKAAEQGYRKAQFELAKIYERGGYHGQDAREALRWYREAENLGEVRARIKIGQLLKANASNPGEFEEAREWFIKAEKAGENLAKFFIGEMYFLGEGVTEDPGLGLAWVKRMISLEPSLFGVIQEFAENGSLFAQVSIARIFLSEESGFHDLTQAFNWFLTAALQGDALAAREVGNLYIDGLGVEANLSEGEIWLKRAAEKGDAQAATRLVQLEVEKKRREAVRKVAEEEAARAEEAAEQEKKVADEKAAREAEIAEQKKEAAEEQQERERKREECLSNVPASENLERHSFGTAFLINPKGYFVTNFHVVTDGEDDDLEFCDAVSVIDRDKNENWARRIGVDPKQDLAVFKACTPTKTFAFLRDNALDLQAGETVYAYGFPVARSTVAKITDGIISALVGPSNDSSYLQHTAPITNGNSGGPLLDKFGLVVGVNQGGDPVIDAEGNRTTFAPGVGYAIKGSITQAFLAAHAVDYEVRNRAQSVESAEIADKSNKFTLEVTCWMTPE
jgi:uncharacterized protein